MGKHATAKKSLDDFLPQRKNANRHTQRGLGMLDTAMSEDGFVAPMTAAADGEVIDGSARLERAAERFKGVEPIIVEHDGTRPIVAVRTDIKNAKTRQAKRIALRANRIAEADLDWDTDVLGEMKDDLGGLWSDKELDAVMGDVGDGDDTGPQVGELEYRVVVDCLGEVHQAEMLTRFEREGLQCRALIS